MQEIKFYHSQRSAVTISIVFGLLFILSSIVTFLFLLDIRHEFTSSKIMIAVGLSIIPIVLSVVFGRKFIKNLRNNRPICTLNSSELVYTEFYYKSTASERIPVQNIKNVTIGKTFINRKNTINLQLYDNMSLLKLNYLSGFLTEKDKILLVGELKKRITESGYL